MAGKRKGGMMSLTDKQVKEVFELLKLASPKQREEFLGYLSFTDFNERLGSGDVTYDDPWPNDVTKKDSPEEKIQ